MPCYTNNNIKEEKLEQKKKQPPTSQSSENMQQFVCSSNIWMLNFVDEYTPNEDFLTAIRQRFPMIWDGITEKKKKKGERNRRNYLDISDFTGNNPWRIWGHILMSSFKHRE